MTRATRRKPHGCIARGATAAVPTHLSHPVSPHCTGVSETQYHKLEARITKMTRVVARELARQGRAKAPDDLTALLREPPEFLHSARIKYTYHRSALLRWF